MNGSSFERGYRDPWRCICDSSMASACAGIWLQKSTHKHDLVHRAVAGQVCRYAVRYRGSMIWRKVSQVVVDRVCGRGKRKGQRQEGSAEHCGQKVGEDKDRSLEDPAADARTPCF
jgi:hypothetical protein